MPVLALFLSAAIVLIDQLLKLLVVSNMQVGDQITAIPYLLDIIYVRNPGAALGILADQRWFFITATSVVSAVFVYMVAKNVIKSKLFTVSAILIIGGGIGNLIDRILLGYVVDFLQLSFFPPVCNFADYCISIGTVLLMIFVLFFSNMTKKEIQEDSAQDDAQS